MSDTPEPTTVRSVDLLKELRSEQASFRFLIRILAIFLIVAAIIIVASVGYFLTQMSSNSRNLKADFIALQAVNSGLAGQDRESMNNDNVRLRESLNEANIDSAYAGLAQRISTREEAAAAKGAALGLAKAHFHGDQLNSSTVQLLRAILRIDTPSIDAPILSETERLIFESAIGISRESQFDELRQELKRFAPGAEVVPTAGAGTLETEEKLRLIAKLEELSRHDDNEIEALGYAGLAILNYRTAEDVSMAWEPYCRQVSEHTEDARKAGANPPHLMLYLAECLRKDGRPQESNAEFHAALDVLDRGAINDEVRPYLNGFDPGIVPEYSQLAHHGVGTTRLAIVAQTPWTQAEDSALRADIQSAQRELEHAAQIRRLRGATAVGETYSTENIGFIHLYRGVWQIGDDNPHWQAAIDHTKRVNDAGAISWNLAVRYVAARQQVEYLQARKADRPKIKSAKAVMDKARRTFRQMPCSTIDLPELKKLMPLSFRGDVDDLVKGKCEAN